MRRARLAEGDAVSARRTICFTSGRVVRRGDIGEVVRYYGEELIVTVRWATGHEGVCLADDVARRRKQGGDGVAA
jgi:hypothetical protein